MVCENASSGLGQKVGQGYYDGESISQVVSMKLLHGVDQQKRGVH